MTLVGALAACSKMNDNIDQYLSQGEIIYIAKPDSVHLFAGKERFKMEFWIRDPRATELVVYWAQKTASVSVPLEKGRNMDDGIVLFVDKDIAEGQHALVLISKDQFGNTSVPDEENVSVYGDIFQASLVNRLVDSKSVSGNKVTINWGNCYSLQETGIQVWYTDTAGVEQTVVFPTAEMGASTVISNVDVTKEMNYSTLYLPEPTAIDTFSTPATAIPLT